MRVTLEGVDLALPADERTLPTDENPFFRLRTTAACSSFASARIVGPSCLLFSSKDAMLSGDVAKRTIFLTNSTSPSVMLLFCSTNCSAVWSRKDWSCAKEIVGAVVGEEADILRSGSWGGDVTRICDDSLFVDCFPYFHWIAIQPPKPAGHSASLKHFSVSQINL